MGKTNGSVFDRIAWRRELRRWHALAAGAPTAGLDRLRGARRAARALRAELDRVIHLADARLALPQTGAGAELPQGADWCWRPEPWRGPLPEEGIAPVPSPSRLGDEVTLFHDCSLSELSLRQLRNTRGADRAPFGLAMDVFGFDGSFLSLVIDLPPEAIAGLRRRHLVRLEPVLELEKPLEIFARLNIKHGPNTEQLVRELPLGEDGGMVEFDLGYSNLNEKRVERMWLDLIFERPEMNRVVLRDLTFSRRLRADL